MENIIKIHLREKDDYKNTYNDEILSYKLSNYILEELKGIETKKKIKFSISTDFYMTDIEKNNLIDMIRNNFGADISELMHLAKKERLTNYLISLLGVISIIIYSLIDITVISEFILILGWVLLGESICNFLYKGIDYNHKIARRKQIVNAKVLFEDNTKS